MKSETRAQFIRYHQRTRPYQLISQQEHHLETKLLVAEVEWVLKRGTEEINDHRTVITFRVEPTNERHPNTASEGLVHLGFVLDLRVLGFDRFRLLKGAAWSGAKCCEGGGVLLLRVTGGRG